MGITFTTALRSSKVKIKSDAAFWMAHVSAFNRAQVSQTVSTLPHTYFFGILCPMSPNFFLADGMLPI